VLIEILACFPAQKKRPGIIAAKVAAWAMMAG